MTFGDGLGEGMGVERGAVITGVEEADFYTPHVCCNAMILASMTRNEFFFLV